MLNKWSELIDWMMRDDCITNDERMEIQTGLTLLRKTFDDAWLKDAIENGHPLLRYVMESALWSQYRLADLGMHIEALRNQAKFIRQGESRY
jgi:hypothetical protein